MPIQFFSEKEGFELEQKLIRKQWISTVIQTNSYKEADLNYVFCDDQYLLEINKTHLNHDYYTDIITFDQAEEEGLIEGDIFISVDRVEENARKLGVDLKEELDRVMVHGLLHLMGWKDSSKEEKNDMRKKEDECLSLRPDSNF